MSIFTRSIKQILFYINLVNITIWIFFEDFYTNIFLKILKYSIHIYICCATLNNRYIKHNDILVFDQFDSIIYVILSMAYIYDKIYFCLLCLLQLFNKLILYCYYLWFYQWYIFMRIFFLFPYLLSIFRTFCNCSKNLYWSALICDFINMPNLWDFFSSFGQFLQLFNKHILYCLL